MYFDLEAKNVRKSAGWLESIFAGQSTAEAIYSGVSLSRLSFLTTADVAAPLPGQFNGIVPGLVL